MGKNRNMADTIELWGHSFQRTSNGLDEEQVVSFVSEIISQRDKLIKRQEHIDLLNQLAERTVAAADDMANQVKEEALGQAKAEADDIISKVEEQAQQLIDEKRAVVIAVIEKCEEFLAKPEGLRQQITASQPAGQTGPATIGADSEVRPEITEGVPAEALEQIQTGDQSGTSEPEKKAPVFVQNQEAADYEGEVALEILPPADKSKILEIVDYLKKLPEVALIEPVSSFDKPLIVVFLREPTYLVEKLRALPHMLHVQQVTNGETTDTTDTQSRTRKIQVKLNDFPY